MNLQPLTIPVMSCSLLVVLPEPDLAPAELITASSRDYYFDFDEEELAGELLAPLPAKAKDEAKPDTDEICALCFLS